MSKQQLLIGSLVIALSVPVLASDADVDEDSLFGGSDGVSEDALFGSEDNTEGDLFGEGGLLTESEGDEVDLAEEFLQGTDTVLLNGDFTLSATTSRDDYLSTGKTTSDEIQGAGTITLDVRPSASVRGLVKADYSVDEDDSDASLREAFIDWTIAEQWYLRAGKQVMHWGVGYFYSPADLINSESIDAQDPEADRNGTDALKVHYPIGNDNYYAYLVPQTGSNNQAVGVKGEWLVDEYEISLAAVSRPSGHNSTALTYYVPANDLNWFAELVLHHGVDSNLHGRSDWVTQSTLGASYSFSDDDDYNITIRGQYFDDGLTEQQRSALSLRWNSMYQSDYSLSFSTLANMTDDSRLNKASLSYNHSDDIKATFSYSKANGSAGSEYARSGNGDSVSLKLIMLSREF